MLSVIGVLGTRTAGPRLYTSIHVCSDPRILGRGYDCVVGLTSERVLVTGLADEIAFRVQAAILEGEYPPGTHLQQDELCARFGVSRTPVREALRILQATNLVDLVPNRGATVRIPSRKELVEVYALRAELEGFACQLAAPNVGPDALEELDRAQAEMERAMAQLDDGGLRAEEEPAFNSRVTVANVRFHIAIHALADNARLSRTIEELQAYFPKDYVWRAIRDSAEGHVLSVDEHHAIRAALATHKGKAARRAMTEHIDHAGRLLIAYLDRHRFWG
jgi:DNA-binding GntR family transcriptional regulator